MLHAKGQRFREAQVSQIINSRGEQDKQEKCKAQSRPCSWEAHLMTNGGMVLPSLARPTHKPVSYLLIQAEACISQEHGLFPQQPGPALLLPPASPGPDPHRTFPDLGASSSTGQPPCHAGSGTRGLAFRFTSWLALST